MTRSFRESSRRVLALVFAALPFGFGLIRAISARHDVRMLWMAVAALAGATVAWSIAKRARMAVVPASFLVLLLSTLLAGGAGYLQGATAAAGIWLVALVLALCFAASYYLGNAPR